MGYEELSLAVQKGKAKVVKELVNKALEEGAPVKEILENGLIAPMGIVIEFETLPQYTEHPEWGIEIHEILKDTMNEYEAKYGLKSAIRMTPNDLREMSRPPIMRSGEYWDSMVKIFTQTAKDGADFLAIESTGGKEINDEAITMADLRTSVFALGCLGARDMKWLWTNISKIAEENGSIPAGDSACGFANTSMVLAEQGFIMKVKQVMLRMKL